MKKKRERESRQDCVQMAAEFCRLTGAELWEQFVLLAPELKALERPKVRT